MPAFIAIGQTVEGAGEIGTLKAFHTAGFLGTEHGPFLIVDPQDAASAVRPPKELGDARFRSRRAAVRAAARAGAGLPATAATSSASRWSARSTPPIACCARRRRRRSISSLEPKTSFDAYNTGRFGQGCLLARRLVEAGARYVHGTPFNPGHRLH